MVSVTKGAFSGGASGAGVGARFASISARRPLESITWVGPGSGSAFAAGFSGSFGGITTSMIIVGIAVAASTTAGTASWITSMIAGIALSTTSRTGAAESLMASMTIVGTPSDAAFAGAGGGAAGRSISRSMIPS